MSPRLLLFLAVLCSAFLLLVGHAVAEDDGLEQATIDVSDLMAPHGPSRAPALTLWPSNYSPPGTRDEKPGSRLTNDDIVNMIQLNVDPASWDEVNGAELVVYRGRLRVRSRPDVVAEVRKYVSALRSHLARRVRVRLGVNRGSVAFPGEAVEGSRLDSASLELVPNVSQGLESLDRRLYVQDYEVEIAQGSVIANPVRLDILSGLAADLIATPTMKGDGVVLSGVVQHAELVGIRTHETGIDEEYLARPYRSDDRLRNGVVELPTLRQTLVLMNTVLPSGAELRVPVVHDGIQRDIRVHAALTAGGPAPGLHPLGGLGLKPLEAYVTWQEESLIWRSRAGGFVRPVYPDPGDVRFPVDAEELFESLLEVIVPAHSRAAQTGFVARPDLIVMGANADTASRARTWLMRREEARLRGATIDVRVLSVASDKAPPSGPGSRVSGDGVELVTAGRVPTLHERRGALLAGTSSAYIADYDVEVAQEARIADPIVGVCFAGLALNLRPYYPVGSDTAEIALQLLYSTQTVQEDPYVSGTRYLGPIDHVAGGVRHFASSIRMPMGGSYVIDAGRDPRSVDRRLLIELVLTAR